MGILSVMIIVLFASMLIKWPYLPLDPRNVMGSMYYVVELTRTGAFEGLGKMEAQQRDRIVTELNGKYLYGRLCIGGTSDICRMQIYSEHSLARETLRGDLTLQA